MGDAGKAIFSSPTRVCTENHLCWDLSPEQIQQLCDEHISKTKQVLDEVGSLDLDNVTFSNTVKALATTELELYIQRMFYFMRHVSPSKKMRAISTRAEKKLQEFAVDMRLRKDVYQRIEALSMKVDVDSLTSEDKRYIERYVKQGRISGLHLPQDKQDEIKNIDKQLIQQCTGSKKQNLATLKNLAKLRARRSALLGFKTYADCSLWRDMANSAEKVSIFLEELAQKLRPLGDKERVILLRLKKERCQKTGLPFDGKLSESDRDTYQNQVIQKVYGVDHKQLKEYFPLEVVTQGLLGIYQEMLGLSFSLVDGAAVWHPDVTLYHVTDCSTQQTVGQFYLDLFARKGKKKSPDFSFELQPGGLLSNGSRQTAVAALVTNFRKSNTTPCLLTHEDVETYFHEFGHVMHFLCAQVDYAVFSSSHVERDFSEVPSQVFQNWVWEKEPLQRVSKHYKTGAPIPDELLDKLIKSRVANVGMQYLQEIAESMLDNTLHTRTGLDPRKEYARLTKVILGVGAPKTTKISSEMFGDPGDGDEAKHYRYLWGEVLAMDMFYSRFKKEGVMNPDVGLDYRNCILKPGASKDAEEMLKNFLGREPNQEAFLLSKGLSTALKTRKRKRKDSSSSDEEEKKKKLKVSTLSSSLICL